MSTITWSTVDADHTVAADLLHQPPPKQKPATTTTQKPAATADPCHQRIKTQDLTAVAELPPPPKNSIHCRHRTKTCRRRRSLPPPHAVADPEENLSGGNSNEWGHFKYKFDLF
jgi:hypothetical protein